VFENISELSGHYFQTMHISETTTDPVEIIPIKTSNKMICLLEINE